MPVTDSSLVLQVEINRCLSVEQTTTAYLELPNCKMLIISPFRVGVRRGNKKCYGRHGRKLNDDVLRHARQVSRLIHQAPGVSTVSVSVLIPGLRVLASAPPRLSPVNRLLVDTTW